MSYSRQILVAALIATGRLDRNRAVRVKPEQNKPREWPAWAKKIAEMRQPGDAGVGDTAKRELGSVGETLEDAAKRAGLPCGCKNARDRWNRLYPYPAANNIVEV